MILLSSLKGCAETETRLLRFLCDQHADAEVRRRVLRLLQGYRWGVPDNAVFFECIGELFPREPRTILSRLPVALTRRGFPDMPCESLAAASGLNSASALALAESLLHHN